MTTTTASAPAGARPEQGAPTFGATFAGELIKLNTSRGVRRNLLLGALLGIGFTVLICVVTGATFDNLDAAQRATVNSLETSLAGNLFLVIFFGAAAVNLVATEYSSKMIRLTFSVTPRRTPVIVAKACAIGIATLLAALVAMFVMLAAGAFILGAYDVPHVGLGDRELWETLVRSAVVAPVIPVIGVFVTFMLRGTAASLSTVLAIVFVPLMFGGLFPRWWQENVIAALPGPAADSIAIGNLSSSDLHLPVGFAVVAIVAWIVVLFAAARTVVMRRDA